MNYLESIILGVVQGLTEFLPVSSSGHLQIAKELLGVEIVENLTFDVTLHAATVLSTIVVLRKQIWDLVRAYVLTAAKNAALNMLPKKQQREELLDISELDIADDQNLFEQVAASEEYERLFRAIRGIPAIYRDVLMLKYVQELTMKEIAALLGRKTSTVHQQITRGKKLLIEQCRKEGMELVQEKTAV